MPPISLGIGLSPSMQGRGGKAWKPYDLFETGSGFLYDFSRADALFQEATGTTPAGVDQNVGLALDVSKWGGKTLAQVLAAQPELRDGGTTGVVGSATAASYNAGSGAGTITRVDVSNQSYVDFNSSANKWYFVDIQNGGPASLVIKDTPGGAVLMSVTSGSRLSGYVRPSTKLVIASSAGTVNFTLHSVKEIPGNHASQATSGARPVLKAGGLTRYDGSDDNLLTTLVPSATMSLFARCKAPATLATTQVLIGGETATPNRAYLALFQNTGKLCGGAGAQGNATIVAANDLRGQILTIGMTIDTGSRVKLFENDVTVYDAAGGGSAASAIALRIGASNPSGVAANFFGADIYQALAINRALTQAEIIKLTNAWSA